MTPPRIIPWWRPKTRPEKDRSVIESRVRLAEARAMRAVATQHAQRLTAALERNHFREAVEYQLRGDGR